MGQGEKYIILDVIYHHQNPAELDSLFGRAVCFRSLAGIVVPNPAAGMNACLL